MVTVNPADVPTTLVPFDHEYVPPPVAVKLIEVVVQFNSVVPVLLVIEEAGGVEVCVMVMDAVPVHPLALVTVTVNDPGAVARYAADVLTTLVPSDHEYVLPPVAVKLIDVTVEVNTVVLVLLRIPAIGNAFTVTNPDTVLVFVQPFELVTVT